ncbi:hypothetical protein EJ02DRAFT_324048, partial [Clathrospora elynae]
ASLFAAAAIAAPTVLPAGCTNPAHCGAPLDPSKYENIDISDFNLRRDGKTVNTVDFKLSGNDAKNISCSTSNPAIPSAVITCGTSKYRFSLTTGPNHISEYGLVIYHETGVSAGKMGAGDVPTYCRAGGDGLNDQICQQVTFDTIVI